MDFMLVIRWQASQPPEKKNMIKIFENEGLKPLEEYLEPHTQITDCRVPFAEVRMIAEGEMILDISGNQLLMRKGDKVIIPSNTKYSKIIKDSPCLSLYAHKLF